MMAGIVAGGAGEGGAPPVPANGLVYPLTYDEDDANGANGLNRLGLAPHVTPAGFSGDGYQSRLRNSSLPAWATSAGGAVSLSAKVRLWAGTKHATRDVIVAFGVDDATANPKVELAAFTDGASGDPVIGFRTYAGSITTRYFGKSNWNYGFRWPTAYLTQGGNKVRPQGILFLDADTALISGHYNDTESRVYKIDLATGDVLGSFTFGTSTYRHVAAWSRRGNGEVWCVDYETDVALEIDVDASFLAGAAVINQTWNLSNLGTNVLTGIEFVTVSSVEYVLIALYNASSTSWLYVIPATEIVDGTTFNIANRHKRFVLWRQCQGIAMRSADDLLYCCHNGDGIANNAPVRAVDIADHIASLADGGALVEIRRHQGPSEYPEDLKFHPTTGECWIGTEGRTAVVDNDGFLAWWRSPLTDNLPVERDIRIDYDGAGTFTFVLDGHLFGTLSLTPTAAPGALSVGGPPQATAGWTNGFALADVRSLAVKDSPFTSVELAALANGDYETQSLTAYVATLTNPGAESGAATGWTSEIGGLGVRSSNPTPRYQEGATNTQYFTGGTSAATLSRQRLAIATITGLSTGEIDALTAAGDLWGRVNWWQANFNGTADPSGLGIRWLDGTPTQLSLNYGAIVTSFNQVFRRRTHAVSADSGARSIDVVQRMDRTAGTNNDGYHDDIELVLYAR